MACLFEFPKACLQHQVMIQSQEGELGQNRQDHIRDHGKAIIKLRRDGFQFAGVCSTRRFASRQLHQREVDNRPRRLLFLFSFGRESISCV
jgi:GMP synthase-like glutamine amidotransferase